MVSWASQFCFSFPVILHDSLRRMLSIKDDIGLLVSPDASSAVLVHPHSVSMRAPPQWEPIPQVDRWRQAPACGPSYAKCNSAASLASLQAPQYPSTGSSIPFDVNNTSCVSVLASSSCHGSSYKGLVAPAAEVLIAAAAC